MIQTVDNFNGSYTNTSNDKSKSYIEKCKDVLGYSCRINEKYTHEFTISLNNYLQRESNTFVSLKNQVLKNSEDEIIITCLNAIDKESRKEYLSVRTGNYIGKFIWNYSKNKYVSIDIKSRFSDIFLTRMLNFANDIYLEDVSLFKAQENKTLNTDYSKFIIYYMFIQKLEKAFLLGLPKSYVSVNHHEMKVKGKIDINRFIKYDIPFKGKVSSTSREQKEIQEIIDVLYKAISIIDKQSKDDNVISTQNISHIKTHLKQHKSNKYVSNETISKAIKNKALQNPIFSSYKKVLEYAKLIINANNLEEKKDADKETFGFLVNVAELFEIYLVKLLRYKMPDWKVIHEEESEVYKTNFFIRNMKPDIVMKKDNKVMVFDAKYKKILFRDRYKGADLDRNDFFQINTYMTYYDKKGVEVIAGGLLYPIEKEFDCRFNNENCEEDYEELKAHSDNWFGNDKTQFIVDGIDLSEINDNSKISDIKAKEDAFIKRIEDICNQT